MKGSSRKGVIRFCAVLIVGLAVNPVHAQIFVWDQLNDLPVNLGQSVRAYAPVGQEFEPTFDSIDVVQLWMYQINVGDSEFIVRLRSESITGPVVAESMPVALPRDYDGVATFHIAETSVTPGSRYIVEIVQTQPAGTRRGWFVMSNGPNYPRGRKILSGAPEELDDLWLRVGKTGAVPVTTISWGRIKSLYSN